jgi:hypothetical protein
MLEITPLCWPVEDTEVGKSEKNFRSNPTQPYLNFWDFADLVEIRD